MPSIKIRNEINSYYKPPAMSTATEPFLAQLVIIYSMTRDGECQCCGQGEDYAEATVFTRSTLVLAETKERAIVKATAFFKTLSDVTLCDSDPEWTYDKYVSNVARVITDSDEVTRSSSIYILSPGECINPSVYSCDLLECSNTI